MFDYIFGLPMHVLVVHAVVVLVPLAAVVAIAFAVLPRWRAMLRWPTAIGAVLSAAAAWVAAQSGEALLVRVSQVRSATTDFDLVRTHTDAGYRVRLVATVFMVVALAASWLLTPTVRDAVGGRPFQIVVAVLLVAAALALIVTVVLAGHAGSAAVWSGLG